MNLKRSSHKPVRVYVSDCEGPISKNDNAYELTAKFIPEGERFFALLSRYDDVLADIVKPEGYKAGDTLKLILPFLKAYGATNVALQEYSSRNIVLVPGAKEALSYVRDFSPAFIVSTSYEQYMKALCDVIDFPFNSVYCTRLDLDRYEINEKERTMLKQLRDEIVMMAMPEIPPTTHSPKQLPQETQGTVKRLDEIFWNTITTMEAGRIFKEVNPVGGSEKTAAVKNIITEAQASLRDVMYVGDSITDVDVFRLVRAGGGLTISFNGNHFAVREAEVAVLSENAVVMAVLAAVFSKSGKPEAVDLIRDWKSSQVERLAPGAQLKEAFLNVSRRSFPKVELVTPQNMDTLISQSTAFRQHVRGEAVGRLG